MTDILTGWTECRATWNKGSQGVIAQIKAIEAALPFPLKGFDCDNGSEFLNHHLVRYFSGHPGHRRSPAHGPTGRTTTPMSSRRTGARGGLLHFWGLY